MGNYYSVTDGNDNDISSNATHIANINPIRYRGYYYDTEMGFYYLQSRYYDPEICRFINADDVDILFEDQDSVLENNLFVYCLNNPVNMTDDSGYIAWWISAAVSGALFDTASYLIGCAVSGKKVTWSGIGKAALTGAITGLAFGALGKCAKVIKNAAKARKTIKYTTGTANTVGKIGEKISGIVKNTKKYFVNGRWRIPDGVNKTKRLLQEVKNVKSLSLTAQLKDFMQLSKSWGYKMELYIRPDTHLSGPLKQAIKDYGVKIRYLW